MRKILFQCETKFGMMYIVQTSRGKYLLANDCEEFDTADRPMDIADNVYTHHSGWDDWDKSNFEGPTDLSEWDCISK